MVLLTGEREVATSQRLQHMDMNGSLPRGSNLENRGVVQGR